jgi:hypothetical protein
MKQVLVEKTDTLEQKDFSTFIIRSKQIAGGEMVLQPQSSAKFNFPLKFKVVHGGNDFEMDFKIHIKIAAEGVLLGAAEKNEDDTATVVLTNVTEYVLSLEETTPVLVVTLNERVAFKQIQVAQSSPEGVIMVESVAEERKADKQIRDARKSKKKKDGK